MIISVKVECIVNGLNRYAVYVMKGEAYKARMAENNGPIHSLTQSGAGICCHNGVRISLRTQYRYVKSESGKLCLLQFWRPHCGDNASKQT